MSFKKSDSTTYQEGFLEFSNGSKLFFLCRPVSMLLEPDEKPEELNVINIGFFPEQDFSEEFINKALDLAEEHDKSDQKKPAPEERRGKAAKDIDKDISSGYEWDEPL